MKSVFFFHFSLGRAMQKGMSKSQKKQQTKESMNDALKQWISETDQRNLQKKIEKRLDGKKPQGMCHVCGINQAKSVCIKCGNSVCFSCYFSIVGLCRNCLSKDTVNLWKSKKPKWETVLGVDWVDD